VSEIIDNCILDRPTTGDPGRTLLWVDRWAAPLSHNPEAVLELVDTLSDVDTECTAGARKSNTLAMRWDEISFHGETWRIALTKNDDPQIVHLSPQAMDILKERKLHSASPWVFPGGGASGHLADPKKAWMRILKEAGIADLRIHDLRRTLGSWQAVTGANSYIIGKSLGHRSQQSTAVYARLNLDPVRDSVNKATDAMLGGSLMMLDKFMVQGLRAVQPCNLDTVSETCCDGFITIRSTYFASHYHA
jgi:integrase